MKEGELKPGDVIDNYIIEKPLADGFYGTVVYQCYAKGQPSRKFAMKIRQPEHLTYLQHEVEVLKKIKEAGGHPSFQQLMGYSEQPHKLYLVLYPLMPPERNIEKVSPFQIAEIDPVTFLKDTIDALHFAGKIGILNGRIRPEHLFITQDNKPFFLGLSDELKGIPEGTGAISFDLLALIFRKFVGSARIAGNEEAVSNRVLTLEMPQK